MEIIPWGRVHWRVRGNSTNNDFFACCGHWHLITEMMDHIGWQDHGYRPIDHLINASMARSHGSKCIPQHANVGTEPSKRLVGWWEGRDKVATPDSNSWRAAEHAPLVLAPPLPGVGYKLLAFEWALRWQCSLIYYEYLIPGDVWGPLGCGQTAAVTEHGGYQM